MGPDLGEAGSAEGLRSFQSRGAQGSAPSHSPSLLPHFDSNAFAVRPSLTALYQIYMTRQVSIST